MQVSNHKLRCPVCASVLCASVFLRTVPILQEVDGQFWISIEIHSVLFYWIFNTWPLVLDIYRVLGVLLSHTSHTADRLWFISSWVVARTALFLLTSSTGMSDLIDDYGVFCAAVSLQLALLFVHSLFLAKGFLRLLKGEIYIIWSFCDIAASLIPTTSQSHSISSLKAPYSKV